VNDRDPLLTIGVYRRYRGSQLREARTIRLLRRLDMPLVEVARVMAAPRDSQAELISSYWRAVELRFLWQRSLADHLRTSLSESKEDHPMFDITTREVGEQTVLTEQRHITVQGLGAWIAEAGERQMRALAGVGGPCGASFVIYHGEVNEDSDGPVEVCSPVDGHVPEGAATRIEPAHREAFARISKTQVRFPDILAAYDAVETWAARNGERVSGPPREIYFRDLMSASADELVADVAYPIASR
jgi:DNA-binding transcriptional MerR regulator